MTREALEALAARCEQATAGNRELDIAIWLSLCGPADRQAYEDGLAISKQEAAFRADYMMDGARYTASVDAALTLVPEGWHYSIEPIDVWLRGAGCIVTAHMPSNFKGSPALAITAAALRARAAQ